MKLKVYPGFALLLTLFAMTGRAAERPLLWAADESGGAPYVFQDPNNADQVVGFEVELKNLLQRELGRPIEFKHYDFKNLIPGLQRGDFDFAMNGLEVLPEYEKEVLFSRPYYVYKLQLAVRKGERRFTTVGELKTLGLAVGTLSGSAAERSLMRAGIEPPALHPYDDQTGMYIDLSNGRVDAVYIDLPVHAYYLKRYPDLELTGRPGEKGYYAIAFRKSDTTLAEQFNAALGRLIDHDELRPIYQKWDVWNDDQQELAHPTDVPSGAEASQGDRRRQLLPAVSASGGVGNDPTLRAGNAAGRGPGNAHRVDAAVRACAGALAGRGLCRILPRHSGAVIVMVSLFCIRLGGRFHDGDHWFRTELRGL